MILLRSGPVEYLLIRCAMRGPVEYLLFEYNQLCVQNGIFSDFMYNLWIGEIFTY